MKIGDKVRISHGLSIDGSIGEIYDIDYKQNKGYRIMVKDKDLPSKWRGWNRWFIPERGLIKM